ncbi:hypothetical protein [Streptomyces sp. NPDC057616]|uniref:hypothetical protein n=1 Tax=Streptomyces sp. NPDC057616 TaxID=3346183 RepID=UPI003688A475
MTGSPAQGIRTVLHPVSDVAAARQVYTALPGVAPEPAHDVGGGRLVATRTDPDTNVLGLLQDR